MANLVEGSMPAPAATSTLPPFDGSIAVPVRATTLTPFLYGSVTVQNGVATMPTLIGDRAWAFALCSALGLMQARLGMPSRDYRGDIANMPWRTSVLTSDDGYLLPPLARRVTLDAEGGFPDRFYNGAAKGNFKDYFTVQEAAHGVEYTGALFGLDPFSLLGEDEIVIRIGINRSGMVRLRPAPDLAADPRFRVRLNSATGALFGRRVPVETYALHDIQMSAPMSLRNAGAEVSCWMNGSAPSGH